KQIRLLRNRGSHTLLRQVSFLGAPAHECERAGEQQDAADEPRLECGSQLILVFDALEERERPHVMRGTRTSTILLVGFSLLLGVCVEAQDESSPAAVLTPPAPPPRFRNVTDGAFPVLGLRYSQLSRVALSAGVIVGQYGGCVGV